MIGGFGWAVLAAGIMALGVFIFNYGNDDHDHFSP